MRDSKAFGIHWFRRDLRVQGNRLLAEHLKKRDGRVLGVFSFDSTFLSRPDFSANRFAFFLNTLKALKNELRASGGDLLALDLGPDEAFKRLLKLEGLKSVSFNRDYEPFARARDERISKLIDGHQGLERLADRDHLLLEPWEVLKGDGTYYSVFTPYCRRWFESFHSEEIQARLRPATKIKDGDFRLKWKSVLGSPTAVGLEDGLDQWIRRNDPNVTVSIPEAGPAAALARLKAFRKHLDEYEDARNLPAQDGTSKLSIYFKNGSLTVPEAIAELNLSGVRFLDKTSRAKYLKELVWREFYYQILYHRPDVEQLEFQAKYRGLNWQNDPVHFKAWQDGLTGYPIVDAGMRQLKTEGWMHNRVRMIVASFLTKDLLIDWRWGEKHFMHQLLDGDLAPNNGGWQWAASTGCDPQPYFRIFNPELQSKKFDEAGDYIRKYVPELRQVEAKHIHAPSKLGEAALKKLKYPMPIVDHSARSKQAVLMYKNHK